MARHASGSAGMAPRQGMPQAWQPPVPAYAQVPVAAHFAMAPRAPDHQPPSGASHSRAFGVGFMQTVRDAYQQIRQFPQQLQQLAQHASMFRQSTLQDAMHAAQVAIHGLQTLPQPMPYQPPHAPAMALGVPAFGAMPQAPSHQAGHPALGVPVGYVPPQPAPWHQPAPPPALHAALQVQQIAQQYAEQARAFNAVALQQQVAQMNLQMQTVQNCMAQLQQSFQANQALRAGAAQPGPAAFAM